MAYINYFSGIIQMLETPKEIFLDDEAVGASFFAELPQIRGRTIIEVYFWGRLSFDIIDSYQIYDYILVEGYLSLRPIELIESVERDFNQVTLSVLKLYPFLLQD